MTTPSRAAPVRTSSRPSDPSLMDQANTAQPRIADYVRPLVARWWIILIAVVAATGGVYAYYAHKPNVYSTNTLVYYQDPGNVVDGTPNPQQTDRTVIDAATLLDSRPNAASVAQRIGYRGGAEALLQQVSVGSKTGSDFITISVNAGNPHQAAAITNAFAQSLVASLDNGVRYQIESALRLTETQLSQAPRGAAGLDQRSTLQAQLTRLQLALNVPTLVAQQVDTALPPTSPSSPKPTRNAIFAFIVSLLCAVALAYGLERFDRRLKTPDEMEASYGRTLLGVLPHSDDPAPMVDDAPALAADFREPFRILRTNIELESLDTPARTIVVSSAVPGEGKSTVARNMALAFRESGQSVAIVDLDLRNPQLPKLFGVTRNIGITDVLRHDLTIEEAAIEIEARLSSFDELFEAMRTGRPAPKSGSLSDGKTDGAGNGKSANGRAGENGHGRHAGITLLCTGPRPANAPAVLASERLAEVLNQLRDEYDVVIIDSAPLLAVTDTVPLLRYADAALFVGRLDVTTRDTAKRLVEYLERIPDLNLLGIVANDLSRGDVSGYGYGYGYGYGAYDEEALDKPVSEPKSRKRKREKQSVGS